MFTKDIDFPPILQVSIGSARFVCGVQTLPIVIARLLDSRTVPMPGYMSQPWLAIFHRGGIEGLRSGSASVT